MSLVIDTTKLVEWQGKLTGVPRVMNELSRRFGAQADAVLVRWDSGRHCFTELTYEDMTAIRTTADTPAPSATTTAPHTLKRIVKGIERRAPIVGSARRHVQRLLTTPSPTATVLVASYPVTPEDTLVVLWGNWHDDAYIAQVKQLAAAGTQVVEYIYDMLPLVTPQYSGHSTEALRHYATEIYPVCTLLIAISEHSRMDARVWLEAQGLHVPPIAVIRLGEDFVISKSQKPQDEVFTRANIHGQDFILCVGTIEARKNHLLLYYVYKLAAQRSIRLPKLVIVGRRGWLSDDFFTLATIDPDTVSSFVFLQSTSDEELSWLYAHCMFSIYPSFYEGWGLPIAESIAHGVPCVASNTSSMPEIAGDLLSYFSPASSDECLAAIQLLLEPTQLDMAKRRLHSYTPTSWDDTFKAVMKHLEEHAA